MRYAHIYEPTTDPNITACNPMRRPMILRIEKREVPAGDTGTIYRLSNDWFIYGTRHRGQYGHGYKFSVWVPGRGKGGTASFVCGADTLKAALALASEIQNRADVNLTRMAFGKEPLR
jgi:hypothetical protein